MAINSFLKLARHRIKQLIALSAQKINSIYVVLFLSCLPGVGLRNVEDLFAEVVVLGDVTIDEVLAVVLVVVTNLAKTMKLMF